MIFANELNVMQDGLRLPEKQLVAMISFVNEGGRFDQPSLARHNPERTSLIAITQFEDGKQYIRDGLHRSAVVMLARDVPVLFDDEYVIEPMTYSMFLEADIEQQWYTPFDPRTEVRKADFFDFKAEVLERIDDEGVIEFIKENKSRYTVARSESHTLLACATEMWKQCHANFQEGNNDASH